jgi:redox-sensitive bicupin YhaK (pirin superfamily)
MHSNDAQSSDAVIETVLVAHSRPVGNQAVLRVLPQARRRAVGPFVFLDHMGPHMLAPGAGFDVGPHPHIGLSTVTYLFEGAGVHRDSLGTVQVIRPGELNWMTAGRGIVHSERSPDELRERGGRFHGLQLWVALPAAHEEDEPSFEHVPSSAIEEILVAGGRLRLLAGTAYGRQAVVRTVAPLFFVEARLEPGAELAFPDDHAERAAYVVDGTITVAATSIAAQTLVAVSPGRRLLRADSAAHVFLLGGARYPEPRFLRWNFVSSSQTRLDQAEKAWRERRFPVIPTDAGELIPMPETAPARHP